MSRERFFSHKARNLLHSALLLGGMVLLLAAIGSRVFGTSGLVLAVAAGLALLSAGTRVPPEWVLKLYRARLLSPYEAPGLYRLVRELARRAELPAVPVLYLVPSPGMNAFALGNVDRSAVGLTDGLLRRLGQRELAGVLAHEISHIANRDLWVMGLADTITRVTSTLSMFGQLLLLVTLPLALLGEYQVPWLTLLLLIAAPTVSTLLQLALSRARELDADLSAVDLTGDPRGLASALARLEFQGGGWLRRLLFPASRSVESSLLRSHPATAERIERLRSLVPARSRQEIPVRLVEDMFYGVRPRIVRVPRWRFGL